MEVAPWLLQRQRLPHSSTAALLPVLCTQNEQKRERESTSAPEGPMAILTGYDMRRGRLALVPVRVGVAPAVLALGARERGEVAAGVDDDRHPLRWRARIDVGEMGAPAREQRSVLERHIQRPASLPVSSRQLLRVHRRRQLGALRVVVERAPERQRVELRRRPIVKVWSRQLTVHFQERPPGEPNGGSGVPVMPVAQAGCASYSGRQRQRCRCCRTCARGWRHYGH